MAVTPVGSATNSPATTPVPTPTKHKQEVQKIVSKSIATSLATASLPMTTASLPNQTKTVTAAKKDNENPEAKQSEIKVDPPKAVPVETVTAKTQDKLKEEEAAVVKTEVKETPTESDKTTSAEKKEVCPVFHFFFRCPFPVYFTDANFEHLMSPGCFRIYIVILFS